MATDFSFIQDITTKLDFGTLTWIVPLVLITILTIAITRDLSSMKITAFPIALLINIAGIPVNMIILFTTGLIFVLETFSMKMLGEMIGSTYENVSQNLKERRIWKRDNIKNMAKSTGLSKTQLNNIAKLRGASNRRDLTSELIKAKNTKKDYMAEYRAPPKKKIRIFDKNNKDLKKEYIVDDTFPFSYYESDEYKKEKRYPL